MKQNIKLNSFISQKSDLKPQEPFPPDSHKFIRGQAGDNWKGLDAYNNKVHTGCARTM